MSAQPTAVFPQPQVEIFDHAEAVAEAVAIKLLAVLEETVAIRGIAHVSLTGGGAGIKTLESVADLVLQPGVPAPDWSKVHIWWGDERLLPEGDAERNDVQARKALLDQLISDHGLPEENIHPMPTSEQAESPEAGALIYAQQLESCAPEGGLNGLSLPPIAVMLLGMGPDAHINSLFPGKDALDVTGRTTAGEQDAPVELGPSQRITLTFDAVHTASRVWVGATGAEKANAVAAALSPEEEISRTPAAGAWGAEETVWHVDRAAASKLTAH